MQLAKRRSLDCGFAMRVELFLLVVLLAVLACDAPADPPIHERSSAQTVPSARRHTVSYDIVAELGRGQLSDPMGLAAVGDEVLIADTGNARIARFAVEGTARGDLEAAGMELVRPMDVDVSKDGSIWIADFGGDAVWRVRDGRATKIHVATPAGLLAVGDTVLVATFYDHTIRQLEGERTMGEEGDGAGQFHYPTDLIRTETELLVVDSYNHRVQVFDLQERWVRNVNGAEDPLNVPVGAAWLGGLLHVADSGHHRLVALDAETGEIRGERHFANDGPHTPSRVVTYGAELFVADPADDVVYRVSFEP